MWIVNEWAMLRVENMISAAQWTEMKWIHSKIYSIMCVSVCACTRRLGPQRRDVEKKNNKWNEKMEKYFVDFGTWHRATM